MMRLFFGILIGAQIGMALKSAAKGEWASVGISLVFGFAIAVVAVCALLEVR